MVVEHLRPLLDNPRDAHMLFLMAEQLAQGRAPEVAVQAIWLGRLTALRKTRGGVKGIVAGNVIRRLTSRTTQQLGEVVKRATSPFQCALSTRAGCECIAHALQALTEVNPDATILLVDGIWAFDLVSRGAMLQGLCESTVPFVRQFYGSPSRCLWENDFGEVHDIDQGEGGEQGDPLMPMLFSLDQHNALRSLPQPECLPFARFCKKSCGDTQGFAYMMGRRRCGIGLAIALMVATFWTEQLAHSIQNSPQCGGVEGNPYTKAS